MKNIFYQKIIKSKKDSSPLNNTISCYHRPRLNNFKSKKNTNQNKNKNINKKETKKLNIKNFKPKIESKLISFSNINNTFENIINNNKENINNYNNSFSNVSNRAKYLNLNRKNSYITKIKYKNINNGKCNNFKSYIINSSLLNYNNKKSISKDIAVFCKIINSINNSHNNTKLSRNNNKKITYVYSKKNNYLKERKIIKIQRWWRKLLYHLYIEKYILIIQRQYRKYIKRNRHYKNKENIKKIILIQKAWKTYMKNKCLNNYYFFSFKKYIKPKTENKINNITFSNLVLDNSNKINYFKSNKKNYFISKLSYKKNQINDVLQKITKLQKLIKKYLKNKFGERNIKKNDLINNECYSTKEKKNYSFQINDTLISKIKIIQKNIRKYLNYNKNKEILRKKFSTYISLKLSKFFILVLNRINLFYFIKIFNQKIKKNINEFIFLKIFNIKKEPSSYSYFFLTIWRHLKINTDTKNEISLLLKNNIPKFFIQSFSKTYIPYINYKQEEQLINVQLFQNNDDDLINYIFYFFEKEKNVKINSDKKYIKNNLNKYNLKNKNIFCITRYIDLLYKDLINKELKVNENKENFFDNDDKCNVLTEENDDEIYIKNKEKNNNFIINRTKTYFAKNFRCKFIDYLNKSCEINKKV